MRNLRSQICGGVCQGYTIRNPVSNPRLFSRSLLQTLDLPRSKFSNKYPVVSFQNFDLFTSAAFLIFPLKNMSQATERFGPNKWDGCSIPTSPSVFSHKLQRVNYFWATRPALFVPMSLIGCLVAFLLKDRSPVY